MTTSELQAFARFIGQPLEVARQIVAQEERDLTAHPGRNIHDGYDYDRQEWVTS